MPQSVSSRVECAQSECKKDASGRLLVGGGAIEFKPVPLDEEVIDLTQESDDDVAPQSEPQAEPKPEPLAEPHPEPKVEPLAEPQPEPLADQKDLVVGTNVIDLTQESDDKVAQHVEP